ncbi:MAG: SprT family zinc-dependent metalloprotease [Pseudohongiellaceae bacterium]|nr:SprT family zinc-dependent metalloprotease [Pseudohongiellaceae bacterium]
MTQSNQDLSILSPKDSLLARAPSSYSVVRSRRKTMAIYVEHERVEVRVPIFVTKKQIQRFVEEHHDWVNKMLAHKASQYEQKPKLRDSGTIFYKGQRCVLRVSKASIESVAVHERGIAITVRSIDEKSIAKALQRWLQNQAREYLPNRTAALVKHLGLQSQFKEVVFRKTKTKWGHCTVDGRIQYNWLIMLAPDAVIDYMICHEVCHLRHMNHSKDFWRLVESVCPDYKNYQHWLKKHEHRLWF